MKHWMVCLVLLLVVLLGVMPTIAQDDSLDVVFLTGGTVTLTSDTLTIENLGLVAPALIGNTPTYFDSTAFVAAWALVDELPTTAQLQFAILGEADGEIEQFTVVLDLETPTVTETSVSFGISISEVLAINPKNADQIIYPVMISDSYSLSIDYTPDFASAWEVGYEAWLDSARWTTTKPCNPKTNCDRG
jgi:hypothetical protein